MIIRPLTLLFIGLSIGAALSGMSQSTTDSVLYPVGSMTRVTFGPDQTVEDLMRIKQDMVPLGISVNYRELRFTEKNTLERIDFTVADGTGNSGSASTTGFDRHDPFGFIIDRSKGASFALGVGHYDHDTAKY